MGAHSERWRLRLTKTQATNELLCLRSTPTGSLNSVENSEEPLHPLLTKCISHALRPVPKTMWERRKCTFRSQSLSDDRYGSSGGTPKKRGCECEKRLTQELTNERKILQRALGAHVLFQFQKQTSTRSCNRVLCRNSGAVLRA